MRWLFAFVMIASGCRLHFDDLLQGDAGATDDAIRDADPDTLLAGHDEDGDTIPDELDVCPHVADPAQLDSDGDRVGDACDPNPTTPTESIAFFDPFVDPSPIWNNLGDINPSYDGESLVADSRTGLLRLQYNLPLGTEVFELAGEVMGQGTDTEQIAIALRGGMALYYCELFEGINGPKFSLSYSLDNMTFQQVATTDGQVPIQNGQFMLRMSNTPPSAACTTTWPVDQSSLDGEPPPSITPTSVIAYTIGLEVRWSYFIHIHTE